jgi:hypothetical protein
LVGRVVEALALAAALEWGLDPFSVDLVEWNSYTVGGMSHIWSLRVFSQSVEWKVIKWQRGNNGRPRVCTVDLTRRRARRNLKLHVVNIALPYFADNNVVAIGTLTNKASRSLSYCTSGSASVAPVAKV